jgi:hypothetical protein
LTALQRNILNFADVLAIGISNARPTSLELKSASASIFMNCGALAAGGVL